MIDIDTGEQIEALYILFKIKGGKKEKVFYSTDVNETINYHKNYVCRYKEGLYLEILTKKKVYNWKDKNVEETFN